MRLTVFLKRLFILLGVFTMVNVITKFLHSLVLKENRFPEFVQSHTFYTYAGLYGVNDSLISRQRDFILPRNGSLIFNHLKFEILHSNNSDKMDDRIYNQMRFVPPDFVNKNNTIREKLILLYAGTHYIYFGDFNLCPVSKCRITTDREFATTADIILWIRDVYLPEHRKPPNQIWAVLFHESPMHTPYIKDFEIKTKAMFNWTISYRSDSTIPHPYRKYSPYDLVNPPPLQYPLPSKNYSSGKTKMAAWFVSNCRAGNDRAEFVEKLQRYIDVDIFGKCGSFECPKNNEGGCLSLLDKTYKFYLSFENSYCRHYITEKFFTNGLSRDIIPVVLGAHPDDYKRVAPPHSYIHVDDFETIKDLADYLKYLDRNHTAYNEYFGWKTHGSLDFDTFFYCRLCMMAHAVSDASIYYTNIDKWWQGDKYSTCFKTGKWKDHILV